MAQQDVITAIAQAIIRQENVNPKYNNPGAIFDVSKNQLRTYQTYDEGYAALLNQVRLNVNRGLTLEEFFGGKPGVYPGYAPVGPGIHSTNRPQQYASNVSSWTGIPLGVPINQVYSIGTPNPNNTVNQPAVASNTPTGNNNLSPSTTTTGSGGGGYILPDLPDPTGAIDAWSAGVGATAGVGAVAAIAVAALTLYFVYR